MYCTFTFNVMDKLCYKADKLYFIEKKLVLFFNAQIASYVDHYTSRHRFVKKTVFFNDTILQYLPCLSITITSIEYYLYLWSISSYEIIEMLLIFDKYSEYVILDVKQEKSPHHLSQVE